MAYDAGSAVAKYIISTEQAEKAADKIKQLWQSIGQSQQPASGAAKQLTAEEVKLAQALARTAEAEARRAAATARKAAEDAKAGIKTAQQATEEQKLRREIINTAAAQDRAAKTALQLAAARDRAAKASQNGGLGPALPRTIDGLSGPALSAARAFITLQAAQKGFEFIKMAAGAADTAKAFDGLSTSAKTTSTVLLQSLRQAADGTIRDVDLIKSANTGLLLTNGKIANDLPKLIEIARASAKSTGQDINFIYDSLVRGIARGSPLIIDNAGITLDAAQAFKDYAQSIGKSSDQLTRAEQQQATLNAVLKAGGDIIKTVGIDGDSASTNIDRATIAVRNLGDALLQKIAPFVGTAAGGLANLLNLGTTTPGAVDGGNTAQGKIITQAADYDTYAKSVGAVNEQLRILSGGGVIGALAVQRFGVEKLNEVQFAYAQSLIQTGTAQQVAIDKARSLGDVSDSLSQQIQGQDEAFTRLAPQMASISSVSTEYAGNVLKLNSAYLRGKLSLADLKIALDALSAAQEAARQAAFQEERETRNLHRSFIDIIPAANAAAAAIAGVGSAGPVDRGIKLRGPTVDQLSSVEAAIAARAAKQAALDAARDQKRLAEARTSAAKIAELNRQLARETDPIKRVQLETQIILERNSASKAHTGELDKQDKLQESIYDSVNKQRDAQLSLLELQIKDRQDSRKEARELAQYNRVINGAQFSAEQKQAAQDAIDLINVNRAQRQQKILEDAATAGGSIKNGKLYQSIPGATGSAPAVSASAPIQSGALPAIAPLSGAGGATQVVVNLNLSVDASGRATITSKDPNIILNMLLDSSKQAFATG